jgi:hypothetical protein
MLEGFLTGREDLNAEVLEALGHDLRRAAQRVRVGEWESRP